MKQIKQTLKGESPTFKWTSNYQTFSLSSDHRWVTNDIVKVKFGILYIDIPLLNDNQAITKSLLPVINSSKSYQGTMLKLPYK